MFDAFKSRAGAVSAEVHRFPTKSAALDFILTFLQGEGVADAPQSYALWADSPFLNGLEKGQLSERVPGLKFEITRELAAEAKVGISQMDWAMANTGALVQDSTQVEQRLVSTLPAIHVALLSTDRILPDLPTLLKKVLPEKSGYIAMITGPSRTSDIERVLTIGVHGPVRLIVAVVDELGEMN
jgi:L-lactate dehydrogenase complex protein LldG